MKVSIVTQHIILSCTFIFFYYLVAIYSFFPFKLLYVFIIYFVLCSFYPLVNDIELAIKLCKCSCIQWPRHFVNETCVWRTKLHMVLLNGFCLSNKFYISWKGLHKALKPITKKSYKVLIKASDIHDKKKHKYRSNWFSIKTA